MKRWISAIRPRTLPLSVSGIIIASFLAFYNGYFDGFLCLLAILTTLSLQILSNLANDYGDGVKGTDNDNRVGPERAIQSGVITPEEMMQGIKLNILICIVLIIALVFRAFRSDYILYAFLFLLFGGLALYAAIKYTVGSSPYGYKALGDLMVFIFFGILSVLGTYFLYAKQIDHIVFMPAIAIGLLSTGVLNLNNMRDLESDRQSGKITIAGKLGFKSAKKYHNLLVIGALISMLAFGLFYFTSYYNLIYLITFVPLITHLVFINKTTIPQKLDSQLKVLALSTFFLALLLGCGYIYNAL